MREGRHTRTAPEANRLDVMEDRKEIKQVKIKGTSCAGDGE